MSEDKFHGIRVIPAKTFASDDIVVPDYIKYYVVIDFDRLKNGPDEVLIIRTDKEGKWWVTNAFLEVTILKDMDDPDMEDHVLTGPFDDFEDAKSAALLYKTSHKD